MLRRGQQRKAVKQPAYARQAQDTQDSGGASGGGTDVLRMMADQSARQFWEKYFGNDREVDWSFFWESLNAEYPTILGEHTDRQSEMLLKAYIDSNQNDSVSVLEVNKMSKDKGMAKGLLDFFKNSEDAEKPVILDTRARKFWIKYIGLDKKVDVDYLWESITQEFDRVLMNADMVNAEKVFIKEIDSNRNNSVTNIEFNSWTRKKGLEDMIKEIVDTSKNVWHDDEDGQWGENVVSESYQRDNREEEQRDRDRRADSRENRRDNYRDDDRRRGGRDDHRGRRDSRDDHRGRRDSRSRGRRDSRERRRDSRDESDDGGRRRGRPDDDDGSDDDRRRTRPSHRDNYEDSDDGLEDDSERSLEARIKREEAEMRDAEMRRDKQREMDRQRKEKERGGARQEQEAEMLNRRRELMQKQEADDAKRKGELQADIRAAKWAESDAKWKAKASKRLERLGDIEKQMKIEEQSRFACMTLKGHEGPITGMSMCGDRLCTSSADTTIKVWDVDKQKVKKTLTGHVSRVNSVASDNKSIISGARDGTVHIWDLRTGEITDTEPTEQVPISFVSMGTVPRHAMIGRQDGEIRLMDMRTPITVVRTFFGHTGAVTGLDFNGEMLASSSADGTAKVWDFGTGTCIHTLKGHYSDVSSIQLCEGKIVTGSYDETIRYWDLASGKCRQKVMFPLGMVSSIRADGSELIAGSLCNRVNVYDSTTGELRYTLSGRDGHTQGVNAVLTHKNQVYSASNDMTAKVWTLLD